MSKLQDKGKDVSALHSVPNHEGVWGSGGIIQIMLSRENKEREVVSFTSQRKWPWYHSTGGSTEPRAVMDVLGKTKCFEETHSGFGCFGEDKILRCNPEWGWMFWGRKNSSM